MLNEYKKRRHFKISPEPKGKETFHKNAQRFVVGEHHAKNLHYDLRLENNGVLVSFAIPKKISNTLGVKRLAINVEDHPLEYINFEGVIPKGEYGAGAVIIWDKGNFSSLENFDTSYKKGSLKLILNGSKLKGKFNLIKIKGSEWLFFKSKDKFSVTTPNSKKIKNPFQEVEVNLAVLTNKVPSGNDYIFETKFDGYRIIAFLENNKVRLITRNNNNFSSKFKSIVDSLLQHFKNQTIVLDGEIIVAGQNGVSNFSELQESIKRKKNNFVYCIFDILAQDGEDLRQKHLLIRKEILRKSLSNCPENLVFSEYIKGNGKKTFTLAKKLGLEGIIAKKVDSLYTGSRNGDWLKIKCYFRQEFVVIGFSTSDKNEVLSAILLGYYKDKKLIYAGKVGTGFTNDMRKELNKKFKKYIEKKVFFENKIKINENIIFLKPKFVAEVQFIAFTKDNLIRQGSFVGLRTDKSPEEVVLEKKYEN